ncbi:uncharacterized protein LOC134269470 [Saccostrea cucullata]|uniref:uncharacterized protein LOC134269470 n=1 Tax=Saccostrea cuccullata TaxID=36930 RepID=UPI002ED0A41E
MEAGLHGKAGDYVQCPVRMEQQYAKERVTTPHLHMEDKTVAEKDKKQGHATQQKLVQQVHIELVCKHNMTAIVADPFNCAQFYDCSHNLSALGKPFLRECNYPDLFSSSTKSCEPFSTVTGNCGRRKEVQAPSVLNFLCSKNHSAAIPDPENCAKFYNCSKLLSSKTLEDMKTECGYPDLFSLSTGRCQNFKTVNCTKRKEPVTPCEYYKNLCALNSTKCIPCYKRLPSCQGLTNGNEAFPGKLWQADYIVCDTNRTMNISHCSQGEYFNPRLSTCKKDVPNVDIPDYCLANPKALLPKKDNCGQYINCSDSGFDGNHTMECLYPDLFSLISMSCQWFENVTCHQRMEPQAPCDYQQNLCAPMNKSCIPCKKRLPSCVTLPDGKNPINWLLWKPDYAICYKNRTIDIEKCSSRFFDPVQRKCLSKAIPSNIDKICKQNPKAIFRKNDNCAQYYNCSVDNSKYGKHLQECKYPDLFSTISMRCENFNIVKCDNRTEPQTPCEYVQNQCAKSNVSCVPCPKRLPSCQGLTNGKEAFQGKLWQTDYIVCDTNRTMNFTQCSQGEYFNPRLNTCMEEVPKVDIQNYCTAHPKALLPKKDNCGQYSNCSDSGFDGNHTMECLYPNLFSLTSLSCQWFENVTCDGRMEPQAPCEYQQNLCAPTNKSCIPCKKRLPSCVTLPDGKNPINWLLWKLDYAICYKNRTIDIRKCPARFFDPVQRKCLEKASPNNIDEICKQNPKAIFRKNDNCAQYYNCSVDNSKYGKHLQECNYPDLFSTISMRCENFKIVKCDNRTEPQAPCEYVQNQCVTSNISCVPCPKRLPSCQGLTNGKEAFQGKLWRADYIVCDTNRTMNINQCSQGEHFNPRLNTCMKDVPEVDIPDFCSAYPDALLPKKDNCGQYINCSDSGFDGNHTMECLYPDLFSLTSMSCQWFENVTCNKRMEPQAPCEYQKNLCAPANRSCIPCKNRLPSCVTLPDGKNPINWLLWKPDYAICYKNRTIDIRKCSSRFFDPIQKNCLERASPNNIDKICKQNPKAIFRKNDNCAQYYNCSVDNSKYGKHLQECKYPDLFSTISMRCENFKTVKCDNRTEPQAPCEYVQNQCVTSNISCVPCPKRLPSCQGLTNGKEAFQGKLWQADYIFCDTNRTINITQCSQGEYFNSRLSTCMTDVPKVDVPDFCAVHPLDIVPALDNCARYFNCSAVNAAPPSLIKARNLANSAVVDQMECSYPALFDVSSGDCRNFTSVTCDRRPEPQAPCEYLQNICESSDLNCLPCPQRLPTCVGKANGPNPFPNKLWSPDFILCYHNRTLKIEKCSKGYFHPIANICMEIVDPGKLKQRLDNIYCM